MTASKILLYFCLSFIGGIFLNSVIKIPQLLMLSFSILGLILISVLFKYKKLAIMGFCILFLVLGTWRHGLAESRIMNNELRKLNDSCGKMTLIGIVSKDPDIREKSVKLTIQPENINGKILVTTNRYPEYHYGDKLEITGRSEAPPIFEGFNYRDYLLKDEIYSVMSWPEIELVGRGFGSPLISSLYAFKNKFEEAIQKFISPPHLGILEALIFGNESEIPKDLKNKLNLTGTRHIAAVSGMNITIISALLLNSLLLLGFWRNQAFYLSVVLLVLYILMVGAPASAVRAGIMGILFLTAQHFGRLSTASRAVVFAAAVMLALNPLLLRLDVGFQLSFLAMLGIIYLQPAFLNFLKKLPNPKFFPLKTTLSTTLAAQIFTLPILIYNFGRMSLFSPIANILIVPFLAPITIFIFFFGIAGMVFSPLGIVLSWLVWLFLTYIIGVVDLFSRISWASLTIENVHWIWLAISYIVLGLIVWRFQESQKLKFLNY